MSDQKINMAIAGYCLTFAGWKYCGDQIYEFNNRVFKLWRQVSLDDVRIVEVDHELDAPIGDVYCPQTIVEFRNIVRLIEQRDAKLNVNHEG